MIYDPHAEWFTHGIRSFQTDFRNSLDGLCDVLVCALATRTKKSIYLSKTIMLLLWRARGTMKRISCAYLCTMYGEQFSKWNYLHWICIFTARIGSVPPTTLEIFLSHHFAASWIKSFVVCVTAAFARSAFKHNLFSTSRVRDESQIRFAKLFRVVSRL